MSLNNSRNSGRQLTISGYLCWQLLAARMEHNVPSTRAQSLSNGELSIACSPQARSYGGQRSPPGHPGISRSRWDDRRTKTASPSRFHWLTDAKTNELFVGLMLGFSTWQRDVFYPNDEGKLLTPKFSFSPTPPRLNRCSSNSSRFFFTAFSFLPPTPLAPSTYSRGL